MKNHDDAALLGALELTAHYRAGTLSPLETTNAVFDRIDAHDPSVNAFCLVDREGALAQARASEERWRRGAPAGAVDGVPISIKDVILTKGWPTLRGSRTIERAGDWNEDAPAVARLREQGAVFIGKTTTPEFGWKGVTDSPLCGITRNPWDTSKTAGGSSGGAAAALALGMGALALGTDAGGSVRIPASFCGVVGHKTTFGRVAAYPTSTFGTLANVGPMARSVADAALLLNAIAAPDPRDPYALPCDGTDYLAAIDAGIEAGLRIAFSPDLGGRRVDAEVAAQVAAAIAVFKALGAHIEHADPPSDSAAAVFEVHWQAGAAELLRAVPADRRDLVDPGLREIAQRGEAVDLPAFFAAVRGREALTRAMNLFFCDYDLLITPTMPLPAFDAGRNRPAPRDGNDWMDWTPFTYPFNLTRHPAISVPCGLTAAGLPVGLQIVGPLYADALVLRAARAFEAARAQPSRFP